MANSSTPDATEIPSFNALDPEEIHFSDLIGQEVIIFVYQIQAYSYPLDF